MGLLDLVVAVQMAARRRHLTAAGLARRARLPPPRVRRLLAGRAVPDLGEAQALLGAAGLSLEEALGDPALLDGGGARRGVAG